MACSTSSFCNLTSVQLRKELVRRGAKTSGRKSELLQRLQDYERNQDFKGEPIIMPEPVLVDWPTNGFSTLTPNHAKDKALPPVTTTHIEGYFLYRMGLDRRAVGDAQALKKGKDLLESNRVLACSILSQDECFYFTAICGASMKKGLSYSLKLKIGEYGDIINSHCECPAGKGQHGTCKHVAALLYAIVTLVTEGDMSGMNEGCTDKLQDFHKPAKRYGGCPVKAEDMPGCISGDMDDPRPLHLRKCAGKQDRMKNLVTNFVAHTGKDIAARYLSPKANLQAAALDHDYLDVPFTECLIRSRLRITPDEALDLERATVGQTKNRRWQEEREWRLTASRFGEICSITSRRNIEKFCESLLGNEEIHAPSLTHGKINETLAIKKFEAVTGKEVQPCGLFILPEYPFLGASPDGLIGKDAIIEAKCPYTEKKSMIKPSKKIPYLGMKDGELFLKKSHNHFDQVQGQLLLSKRSLCYFVVYTKIDIKVIEIPFDEPYCKSCLIPKLEAFFDKYYVKFLATRL